MKKLESLDYDVYGIDRHYFDRTYEDVLEKLALVPWKNIKRIYHLGAITNTRETDPIELHKFNVDFSIRLFIAASKHDIPVHYASSASVYGTFHPSKGIYQPLNHYAMSKLTVDMWVQDHMYNRLINGFRFFNVYGPDEQKGDMTSIVSKMIEHAKDNRSIILFEGSEKFARDFIHVDDVVDIFTRRYEFATKGVNIWDVGTGVPQNIEQIAKLIQTKTKKPIVRIPMPGDLVGKYQAHTEAVHRPPGTEKIKYTFVRDWIAEVL